MRTGVADLPLHSGRAPRWLFARMTQLAAEVVELVVLEEGVDGFFGRLSDPHWFQAFGCVLGFDWHSSGLTTTTCGAIKEGLRGREEELGLFVAGGKGNASRRTPDEIVAWCERTGRDAEPLVAASRTSAKVDSAAVQDGYQIYHHAFFFDRRGAWAVVQQGMNEASGMARRYHWTSSRLDDFVCEPHAAICCDQRSPTLNLVARDSAATRIATAELARERPIRIAAEVTRIRHLVLPKRHDIRTIDIAPERLGAILAKTYDAQAATFQELLMLPGVGAKTLRALALVAELVYGATPSYEDPARFGFAHGGKDGIPYPVDRALYDNTIDLLARAVRRAKLGETEEVRALRRLDTAFGSRRRTP
ncbi:MAG: DUF763 domain-containing protein [Candidatus Bipolaricaulota bacterium]|nr:DUF763 domain-containing protein [Candidatus Bipolaricaulota bacterium]